MKVWECKIVVPNDFELPNGFDSVPRRAAIEAVEKAGIEVSDCFSGWNGKLTDIEEYIVKRDLGIPVNKNPISKERICIIDNE